MVYGFTLYRQRQMRGVKGHGERLKSTEEELLLLKFISIVPREEGGAFRKVKEKVRFLTGWHKRPGAGGH